MKRKRKAVVKRRPRIETSEQARRTKDQLPDRASALIRVAVDDLVAARRSGYKIDMGDWHSSQDAHAAALYDPRYVEKSPEEVQRIIDRDRAKKSGKRDKHCAVCFAGSVMACTLNVDSALSLTPLSFPITIQRKLAALNDFREGSVDEGLSQMRVELPRILSVSETSLDREVPGYDPDEPQEFIRAMRALADDLEEIGL